MVGGFVSRSGLARPGVGTGVSRCAGLSALAARLAVIALLGSAASSLALPAWAANFNVSSASQLNEAIGRAANGDTITFASDIEVSARVRSVTFA
jgi:hypothetical protein